jgi:hypothetical protein
MSFKQYDNTELATRDLSRRIPSRMKWVTAGTHHMMIEGVDLSNLYSDDTIQFQFTTSHSFKYKLNMFYKHEDTGRFAATLIDLMSAIVPIDLVVTVATYIREDPKALDMFKGCWFTIQLKQQEGVVLRTTSRTTYILVDSITDKKVGPSFTCIEDVKEFITNKGLVRACLVPESFEIARDKDAQLTNRKRILASLASLSAHERLPRP